MRVRVAGRSCIPAVQTETQMVARGPEQKEGSQRVSGTGILSRGETHVFVHCTLINLMNVVH